ncbi:MAG: hypothetical protein NW241_06220 [Bacteroidia bacterium]|nr:hypothetical protein [Bacteroidia bacterium]
MKPAAGIALLCCLILPHAGLQGWLAYETYAARQAAWERLEGRTESQTLVYLRFSRDAARTQLRWEHAREFEYRGQMYDIVSEEIRSDSVRYGCWPDARETELRQAAREAAGRMLGAGARSRQRSRALAQLLTQVYMPAGTAWQPEMPEKPAVRYAAHAPGAGLLPPAPEAPPPEGPSSVRRR